MKLTNPVPLFLDGRGALLDAGYVYIGQVNTNPETPANQLPLFKDAAMTIPIAQPLRTLGGVVVDGVTPVFVYFTEGDYSITVRDADSNLVSNIGSSTESGGVAFQPLDSDLTAIAALATTAFGRSVLALADAAAARAWAGIGTAGALDFATPGQVRANTPDKVLITDDTWAAAVPVALVEAGGTVAFNLAAGWNFTLAMTGGPWTLGNPTNAKPGQSGFVEITQDGTGGRVLNFAANWDFAGGVAPVLSTGANVMDILNYEVVSSGRIFASLAKAVG